MAEFEALRSEVRAFVAEALPQPCARKCASGSKSARTK